jgi:hypothetical protein
VKKTHSTCGDWCGGVRQSNLEFAASLRAAADASGASGELAGLRRPLRLRARTERRRDQRREDVDAWARMVAGARCSVPEQRCARKARARWRACCAGRWAAVTDDSAAMSTDAYDSMSSEESESSGLVEGREGVCECGWFTMCGCGAQLAQKRVACRGG